MRAGRTTARTPSTPPLMQAEGGVPKPCPEPCPQVGNSDLREPGGAAGKTCQPSGTRPPGRNSQAERNQRARFRNNAAVAQQVERELPKLEVAGSRPVRRFLQMLVRLSAGRHGVSSQLGLGQAAAFRPKQASRAPGADTLARRAKRHSGADGSIA